MTVVAVENDEVDSGGSKAIEISSKVDVSTRPLACIPMIFEPTNQHSFHL